MRQVLPLGTTRPQYDVTPLPGWVEGLREHQVTAVREIVQRFRDGTDVVFLDAPVGSGKTLIAELVRRELGVDKALYICTDKALQDQVLGDFSYAKMLKGRSNYIPQQPIGDITCEDCTLGDSATGKGCAWCPQTRTCPYLVARKGAIGEKQEGRWTGGAELAVLNTAYLLTAANRAHILRRYPLVIADECDLLEGSLIGFVEYYIPRWAVKELGLNIPGRGSHKKTLVEWLDGVVNISTSALADMRGDMVDPKHKRRMKRFVQETKLAAEYLREDLENPMLDDRGEIVDRMIRDYGSDYSPVDTFKLRPITVGRWGAKNLWRHGTKWLCMSGTIISPDEMADSLGLPLTYDTVEVPSSFPVENRPIILAPVASITYRAEDAEYRRLVYAIEQILAEHVGRVLVHCTSYALAKRLHEQVDTGDRPSFTHQASAGKDAALSGYLSRKDSVLFTPSLARGVDLADDKCRVQIVAKCPFPSLGDPQVSRRMHLPGGQQWYAIQTVRDIVQMTGRGVRHEADTCVTYILDAQFTKNIWGRNKTLFPGYFRDAVRDRDDIRWLIEGLGASRR